MIDKFDQFVATQIESLGDGGSGLNIEQEKEIWLKKLNELYSLVNKSLSDHISKNNIVVEYEDINLTEELLGTYSVKMALIKVGQHKVKLQPIGTFLIGARGRVDMIGPRGTTRFTIVPPAAIAPQVRVTIFLPGENPHTPEQIATPETWVWKIATPPPRITYIDLNNETFREALMGVISG